MEEVVLLLTYARFSQEFRRVDVNTSCPLSLSYNPQLTLIHGTGISPKCSGEFQPNLSLYTFRVHHIAQITEDARVA